MYVCMYVCTVYVYQNIQYYMRTVAIIHIVIGVTKQLSYRKVGPTLWRSECSLEHRSISVRPIVEWNGTPCRQGTTSDRPPATSITSSKWPFLSSRLEEAPRATSCNVRRSKWCLQNCRFEWEKQGICLILLQLRP